MEDISQDAQEGQEIDKGGEAVDPWAPPPQDPEKTYGGVHARIDDGVVREIFEQPDDGFAMQDRFHPAMKWVEITNLSPRPRDYWTAEQGPGGVWQFAPPGHE